MGREPKRIILDMDVTDDPTHGSQDGAAFNGSYQHECYTPLLIFCGRHLLSAKLRPANVDPAAGALGELQRLIAHIRGKVNGPRRHFVVTAFNAEQVH